MSNYFERFPIIIFQIVQKYAENKDYHELMNCNRFINERIKIETIQYHFIGPERWKKSHPHLNEEEQKNCFSHFINTKVKNPSNQITISMKDISISLLQRYSYLFSYPCKVTIDAIEDGKDFNFNVFNNISHVSLLGFGNVERITSGFENVNKLEILQFDDLISIHNINQHTKTLQTFILSDCELCEDVDFPVDNIESIEIYSTSITKLPFTNPSTPSSSSSFMKLKEFTFTVLPIESQISLEILDILRLPTIEYGCISGLLPSGYVSIFQNIPYLQLNHYNTMIPLETPFPPFYGKHLHLTDTNLLLWTSASFMNLKRLKLSRCSGDINFQSMTELTHLTLIDCKEITMIPTIPKLRFLSVHRCNGLITISSPQPALHTLTINFCSNIVNLPSLKHQLMRLVSLKNSDAIHDVSILGKVIHLEIENCSSITSLTELSQVKVSRSYRRKVILRDLVNLNDIGDMNNLDTLELYGLPLLTTCENIHNIDHLSIARCSSLITTEGIKNINKSLVLSSCSALTSLVSIEGIPSVGISLCAKIDDFSSLRNHKQVIISLMHEEKKKWIQEHQEEHQIESLIVKK